MAQPVKLVRGSNLTVWASVCVVVGALYFAQEVLIPLALATLFTFLLTPLVKRLERRLPRVPAVLAVVLASVALVVTLGWVVERQFVATAGQLPAYAGQIRAKIARMGRFGGGMLRATADVERTMKAVTPGGDRPTTAPATASADPTGVAAPGAPAMPGVSAESPLPVRDYPDPPSPVGQVLGYVGPVLSPLATAGMVVVFTTFMLLGREDLRDRLLRLLGGGREHITLSTRALNDTARRISRFLLMQFVVNATYGVAVVIGLWVIGRLSAEKTFPSVLLWGLLCCVLRFVPYIGPWVAAAFPVALSFALFKSSGVFLATALFFVVIELLSNNLMEPWLYGSSTGMSAVAILLSAVFWTWLWGPIGLLMATPLTVCLVVLGKHVPQLRFLDILLGDEPVLDPPTRVYQRLLARDEDEAADLAQSMLAEKGLEATYNEVLVPVLGMAEKDRRRRRLDADRHDFLRAAMREIVADLAETARLTESRAATGAAVALAKGGAPAADAAPTPVGPSADSPVVLCLPAEDVDDEVAAGMLARLLERRGYRAVAASQDALASEMIEAAAREGADVVCVSALPPAAVPHARYLVKRLRARFPSLPIVIGLWTERRALDPLRDQISPDGPARVAATLAEAVDQVRQVMPPGTRRPVAAVAS